MNVFEIIYEDSSRYLGNVANNFRNGYGIYYYANGDIYAGDWKDNMFEGQGIYFYSRGDRFEGTLINGLK